MKMDNDSLKRFGKQNEDEIVFMFNRTNLDENHKNINLNSYCDKLLDKINKDIEWTNDIDEQNNDNFNDNFNDSIETKFQYEKPTNLFTNIEPKRSQNLNNFLPEENLHSNQKSNDLTNGTINKTTINKSINCCNKQWISEKRHGFIDYRSSSSSRSSSTTTTTTTTTTEPHSTLLNEFKSNHHHQYRFSIYDNCDKLSIYLAHSTLIDDLMMKQKSITNDNHLTNDYVQIQLNNDGRILPHYIEQAIIYLTKFGLDSVGIFRKSGVKSRINQLKEKIQLNDDLINFESTKESVYDVADLIKTWLRDLRPPLLTNEIIEMYMMSNKSNNDNNNENNEFNLWYLNDCHRYLLFIILKFLSIVSRHSSENQMNVQNLAICFAPSICNGCDNEKQIQRAQKCLQYCIENYELLFYININNSILQQSLPIQFNHTSVIIINASPNDILARLLYERHIIDKLISRWTILNNNQNQKDQMCDIFEFDIQFSCLLPMKKFQLERRWLPSTEQQQQGGWELIELSESIRSNWIMVPNGQGKTIVKHEIYIELRGLSNEWYRQIYSSIHDKQLKYLAESFMITPINDIAISEV